MIVRELITLLGFEVDDKQIEKADAQVKVFLKDVAILTGAVAASAATLFGFAKTTADAGDAALNAAQKYGVAVETFQSLAFAFSMGDVEAAALGNSLKFLNKNLDDARNGGKEAQQAFAKLGLMSLVRNGADAESVLKAVADRFEKMPNGPKKTSAAIKIFGKAGADMIPTLNQGSAAIAQLQAQAESLGIVLSHEDAVAADEFNDSLVVLKASVTGLRNAIGVPLFKAIQPVITQFAEFVRVNRALIAQNVGEVFEGLTRVITTSFQVASRFLNLIVQMTKVFGGLGNTLKLIAQGFAIFYAGKILIGLGKTVQTVATLVVGMRSLGMAAAIAQAKIFAIPLAIGAAVAALALLVEDFIGFTQGKDSLIGRLLNAFPMIGKAFMGIFDPIIESMKALWQATMNGVVDVGGAIRAVGALTANVLLMPLRAALGVLATFFNMAGKLLGTGGGGFVDLGNMLKKGQDFFSFSPTSAAVAGPTTNTGGNVSVQAPITVTVPDGTPASQVGDKVFEGVRAGIGDVLRPAGRALRPGVSY